MLRRRLRIYNISDGPFQHAAPVLKDTCKWHVRSPNHRLNEWQRPRFYVTESAVEKNLVAKVYDPGLVEDDRSDFNYCCFKP